MASSRRTSLCAARFRRNVTATAILVGLALIAWSASAAKPADGSQVLSARFCPALFGSPEDRSSNHEHREHALARVDESAYTINLVHETEWSRPEPIHFRGLELVDTRQRPDDGAVALVRVSDEVGDVACRAGLYRLRVDDSIGADGQVLAVLDDVVLLETKGELHYLKTAAAERPVFRMIWRSPWKMLMLPGQQASAPGRTPHRSPARTRRSTRSHRRR